MSGQYDMRAVELMARANHYFHTEFLSVVHADKIRGSIEAVVRDSKGLLWLCKEETFERIDRKGGNQPVCVLVPVWGPAPDPIDPLPAGYSPATTAVLAEAAARLSQLKETIRARPAA